MLLQEIGDRALRREPIFQDHVDLFSEALHPARAGLTIGRTGQCPSGRCTFVGRSPPTSVVGRDGLAIGRFGRFPEPPAVILYLRPPPPSTIAIIPPVNNRDHPPPSTIAITPVNNRDHPPPASEVGPVSPVPRAEFGSQSSPAVPFMGINGRLPMLILC